MRGGDERASYSPSLTDADTITEGSITGHDADNDELFKLRMLLTFAETRIIDLKDAYVKEYSRAKEAEERADNAAKASSLADPDELRATRQEMLDAFEEKDAALALRDQAQKEKGLTYQKAEQLREALRSALANQTTMVARDTKIEHMIDKYDDLNAKHFATLETVKKVKKDLDARNDDVMFLRAKNDNLEFEREELHSKLTLSQRDHDRYVELSLEHYAHFYGPRMRSNSICEVVQGPV